MWMNHVHNINGLYLDLVFSVLVVPNLIFRTTTRGCKINLRPVKWLKNKFSMDLHLFSKNQIKINTAEQGMPSSFIPHILPPCPNLPMLPTIQLKLRPFGRRFWCAVLSRDEEWATEVTSFYLHSEITWGQLSDVKQLHLEPQKSLYNCFFHINK